MKRYLLLLPVLLGLSACGAQPQPTRNAVDGVNATLTAIALDNPQIGMPQADFTPTAVQPSPTTHSSEPIPSDSPTPTGSIPYFWPAVLPDGVVLSPENSRADADGFALEFIDSNQGIVLRLLGGAEADQYPYCASYENNPSEPVQVHGLEGCYPAATGGGSSVEWMEDGAHYVVGGMGVSKDLALSTAEQLESINLSTLLARLAP